MSLSSVTIGTTSHRRWSPLELSNLRIWLDASDASTLTISTGVSQWNDKSGNGFNFAQSTGANQPTKVDNDLNGLSTIDFDGSAHRMYSASAYQMNSANTSPNTLFSVVRFDAVAAQRCWFGWSPDNSGSCDNAKSVEFHVALGGRSGALSVHNGCDYGQKTANSTVTTGTWYLTSHHILSTGSSGSNVNIFVDGASKTLGAASASYTSAGGYSTTTLAVGLGARYDKGATWDNYLDGKIAEIVLLRSELTAADRQRMEGYLAHKWGLTGNLASDHPYKNIRP